MNCPKCKKKMMRQYIGEEKEPSYAEDFSIRWACIMYPSTGQLYLVDMVG